MSTPKIHHYVPQFLLREFATGEKVYLHAYDLHTGRTYPVPIGRTAAEIGFNSVEVRPGVTAERAFGMLEKDAAPLLQRIVREESLGWLSEPDRELIALFAAVQHLRTRNFRDFLLDMNAHTADLFRGLGLDPAQDVGGFELIRPEDLAETAIRLLGCARELVPMLVEKAWVLYRNDTAQPFYVSDNPVGMENLLGGGVGLGVPGVAVSLPLSGSLMLSISGPYRESGWRRMLRRSGWIHPVARRIGPRMWRGYADTNVLLDAADTGCPVPVTVSNVLHYNAVRVYFANRHVYSGSDSFDQVRHLIDAHPEWRRGGPRVEIADRI